MRRCSLGHDYRFARAAIAGAELGCPFGSASWRLPGGGTSRRDVANRSATCGFLVEDVSEDLRTPMRALHADDPTLAHWVRRQVGRLAKERITAPRVVPVADCALCICSRCRLVAPANAVAPSPELGSGRSSRILSKRFQSSSYDAFTDKSDSISGRMR